MENNSIPKFCKLNLILLCHGAGNILFFHSINSKSNTLRQKTYSSNIREVGGGESIKVHSFLCIYRKKETMATTSGSWTTLSHKRLCTPYYEGLCLLYSRQEYWENVCGALLYWTLYSYIFHIYSRILVLQCNSKVSLIYLCYCDYLISYKQHSEL